MSRGSEKNRAEILGKLALEFRQFNGLGASFFRVAATRIGMTVTDMQVLDILDSMGLATAGQLADLTGLTTGAITGMINRLEEAGLVQRERDPNDGRRVIVRLTSHQDKVPPIGSMFDSVGKAWNEMVANYDDEQLAFLLEFLNHSNAISRQAILRLRESPESTEQSLSSPLGNLERGQLVVSSGLTRLVLRADEETDRLYQVRFEGDLPEVKAKGGHVTIRYPRRLWVMAGDKRKTEVSLSPAIPWEIVLQGGAAEIIGELGKLNLAGLEVKGGLSTIRLELPLPSGVTPIKISGGASEIIVHRPIGVAARVHLKGWVSEFVFDDQTFSALGSDARLQSRNFEATVPYYDIEISSSASSISITAG